jgi:predicted transcriptional regulator
MDNATHRSAADLIKQARHRSGLTQRQLAARSGVAQPVIARLETGRSKPAFATVERLLGACGASLELKPLTTSITD